jgi:hypothetical protein
MDSKEKLKLHTERVKAAKLAMLADFKKSLRAALEPSSGRFISLPLVSTVFGRRQDAIVSSEFVNVLQ